MYELYRDATVYAHSFCSPYRDWNELPMPKLIISIFYEKDMLAFRGMINSSCVKMAKVFFRRISFFPPRGEESSECVPPPLQTTRYDTDSPLEHATKARVPLTSAALTSS